MWLRLPAIRSCFCAQTQAVCSESGSNVCRTMTTVFRRHATSRGFRRSCRNTCRCPAAVTNSRDPADRRIPQVIRTTYASHERPTAFVTFGQRPCGAPSPPSLCPASPSWPALAAHQLPSIRFHQLQAALGEGHMGQCMKQFRRTRIGYLTDQTQRCDRPPRSYAASRSPSTIGPVLSNPVRAGCRDEIAHQAAHLLRFLPRCSPQTSPPPRV